MMRRKMCEIAESLGYRTGVLENEQATVSNSRPSCEVQLPIRSREIRY